MKRLLLATVLAVGFASPAFAAHCPKDVKLIDAALSSNPNADAKSLRDKGAQLHADGKHKESTDALHEAMKILGIEH